MTRSGSQNDKTPSQLIDARIEELSDWRGEMLSRLHALVEEADPDIVEEWKWRGVPVWYHDGMVCTGETYKDHVKVTFAKGAALEDRAHHFNSSLEGNTRRAIDFLTTMARSTPRPCPVRRPRSRHLLDRTAA